MDHLGAKCCGKSFKSLLCITSEKKCDLCGSHSHFGIMVISHLKWMKCKSWIAWAHNCWFRNHFTHRLWDESSFYLISVEQLTYVLNYWTFPRIFGIRAKISQILILNSFDLGGALFLRSSFFFFKIEDERSKLISSKLGTRFKNSQMSISVCFHLMKMNYQLKFHILVALTLTWIGFITHA